MSVRKRGGFYCFEFMEGGRRYRGTLNGKDGRAYARTKQEARDRESEIRIQVRNGTLEKEVGLEDFGEFFDSVYIVNSKNHKIDWKHDEYRGEVLKTFFAGRSFSQITPMLVVGYINERLKSKTKRETDRSPVTVHKEVDLLSSIFRMAVAEGVALVNPCGSIPWSVRKKLPARNKRDRFLSDGEEEQLFAHLVGRRLHIAPIVRFDLETGLRRGELFRLEVEHVNLSNTRRVFKIDERTVSVEPGELLVVRSKNGKPRTVPLTDKARHVAESQLADATTGRYLFTNHRTGGVIAAIRKGFANAVRDAKLEDFRFHDLRHTFATRLNEAGVDPFTIRDLLGHSATAITGDYTHTTSEGRRRAIEAVSAKRGHPERNYVRIAS
jgi:integrase